MDNFPSPNKNAVVVAKIAGAICSSLPGVSTLRELISIYLEDRLEFYQRKLIDEVKLKGVEFLDSDQVGFFVPASYRFFEQVRMGDFEHNISILGRIIADKVSGDFYRAESGDIGRVARQIEYLSKIDLIVLACAIRLHEKISLSGGDYFVDSETLLYHFPREFSDTREDSIRSSLSLLCSRGLLYPDGATRTGKSEEMYFVSDETLGLNKYLFNPDVSETHAD